MMRYKVEVEGIDSLRIMLARLLKFLWYRLRTRVLRVILGVLMDKLAYGIRVKVGSVLYVITSVFDLGVISPEFELETFRVLTKLVKPGLVFIDVGAHIGKYTFPVARVLRGDGVVVAIEPNPRVFRALMEGVKLNGFRNVVALNIALGDRDGNVVFCEKLATGTSSVVELEDCLDVIKVPMRSLDSLVAELVLPKIDVIKIDVEGAEMLVLKGAISTLKKFKPHIFVEVRHRNFNEFRSFMDTVNYTCKELERRAIDSNFYCYYEAI